jgi:hypothetical protein
MSGDSKEWAAMELNRQAEDEHHEGTSAASYDPFTRTYRDAPALDEPDSEVAHRNWPADKAYTRIIRVLEELLILDQETNVDESAEALDKIVLSYSAEEQHGIYLQIVEMIISATKFVDGHVASMTLAQLVASLASRDDLVNTTGAEVKYDLGEHGRQPVVISPGAALTDDRGLRIWSEMPGFQEWITENVERK